MAAQDVSAEQKFEQLVEDPQAYSIAARSRADAVARRDTKRAIARKRASLKAQRA